MTVKLNSKIAIIGTGISGLGAALLLHPHHTVTIFEKNDYIGGHSRTIPVMTKDGTVPVDTGFIVFNKRNYPLLTRLFDHLQVPIVKSDMSFGVSINDGWLEYGTQKLSHIFAQKQNYLRPRFLKMVRDILRFNKETRHYLDREASFTLGQCLDALKMGDWFRHYFLLAMGGAIWSMPLSEMLQFPASTFLRFFDNHGLLTINDHPQWYTVKGGSREYVRRLTASFQDRIHTSRGVVHVQRQLDGVTITDNQGCQERYDHIVFACHADQALKMLSDATDNEKTILSAFQYQPNRAVLHSDISFMPQRRKAWASWVYLSEGRADQKPAVSLSYWMNNLQPLSTAQPLIVTLNPGREPKPEMVHNDYMFEHPIFDVKAIQAQSNISQIQGKDRLWFCGAYQRYGFHEDGLNSAVKMVEQMGITPQW
jgi:predicted NAD/FAD-binding protein